MRADRVLVAVGGGLLVLSPCAFAAPVTTTYCIEQSTSFTDAGTGDKLNGTSAKLVGSFITFYWVFDGSFAAGWYLDDTTGCITLDQASGAYAQLDTGKVYEVVVSRNATLNSNDIHVVDGSGNIYQHTLKTNLVPSANHTYSYANGDSWTRASSTDQGMIMVAASRALLAHNAGISGEVFAFRDAACPTVGNSCFDYVNELIYIGAPTRKFTIASTMGLAVGNFANGHDDIQADSSATLGGCAPLETASGPTRMNTREFTSEAAYRGISAFYSAAAFNDDGIDDDCDYEVGYQVDWDSDGFNTGVDDDHVFSCDGAPAPTEVPGLLFGYLDTFCTAAHNKGTEVDWLSGLWGYHTSHTYSQYTVSQIFGMFDDANPDSWDFDGNQTGSATDDPEYLLETNSPDVLDFQDVALAADWR